MPPIGTSGITKKAPAYTHYYIYTRVKCLSPTLARSRLVATNGNDGTIRKAETWAPLFALCPATLIFACRHAATAAAQTINIKH